MTKVKVDKITNLSEARYCAGMGVDFLSFPVSSIDPKTYAEITGWVAGPKFGIEVDKQTVEQVQNYETDFVQINHEDIDLISKDKKIIPVISLNEWSLAKSKLISLKDQILFLEVVSISPNDLGESLLKEMTENFDVFIKLSKTDRMDRVLKLPVSGISLEGGTEQRPGLKEYPLSEILEKLEQD